MSDPFDALRRDVSFLGRVLGDTLVEQEGPALLALEEEIRALSKTRRTLEGGAADLAEESAKALTRRVASLDTKTAELVARAFTHYFQLVNLAEQHHRTRRLRDAARSAQPLRGSLAVVFGDLAKSVSRKTFVEALQSASIELVFTAHPSEAQRRTVLEKHRRLVHLLAKRERSELTPSESEDIDRVIREEVITLWQTDEIRQAKPRVGDEVKNVLFYLEEILFPLLPRFYAEMERAFHKAFGDSGEGEIATLTPLRFGSWVGADMDGNPNVTPKVAVDTALAQATRVLDLYVRDVSYLGASLSQSTRRVGVSPRLLESIAKDAADMPELSLGLEQSTHHEPYRRKLRFVEERLRATRAALVRVREEGGLPVWSTHAYAGPGPFIDDLELIQRSLEEHRGAHAGASRVRDVVLQARTFGFHLASLDVRIPADWVRKDARVALGLPDDAPLSLGALENALTGAPDALHVPSGAGMKAVLALAHIRLLTFGGGAESLVLSMTHGAEDMLSALVLARLAGLDRPEGGGLRGRADIAIVPLFETLDDLDRAADELRRAVTSPSYSAYLNRRHHLQQIMLGYSDSNKDAGIVGSSFALYRAQMRLVETASEFGVSLKIFHGRGGSIGRGGGPSQRAIESLPFGSVSGRFKLTEQGEVLGWKYLIPEIAERNLELTVAGVLEQSLRPNIEDDARLRQHEAVFEKVSAISVEHYRSLVNDPSFPVYYAATTPIQDISLLNIGSRPARRSGERGHDAQRVAVEDLRAIPWVFAWTQSRQMVPGWFGAGRALGWLLREVGVEGARKMREQWPFFATTLDAIAVALAQADMTIAARYADLCEDRTVARRLFRRIALDHGRALRAVRRILDQPGPLAPRSRHSTLARSIELRNPYVDPLSFIQIELLRRKRANEGNVPSELERAILLTINGIAAGLRSTG